MSRKQNDQNKNKKKFRAQTQSNKVNSNKDDSLFFIGKKKTKLYLFLIFIATIIVYAKTIGFGFIYNWDDAGYILKNDYIKSLNISSLGEIFSSFHMNNYHPITTLSYAIEYSFVGETPWLYHFNNVILHLVNAYLVYLLFSKIIKGKEILALIVAALFAIHPMHVESVAWVSERKDILYTLFFLIGLIRYVNYIETQKKSEFFYSGLFFILSCFSKSAAVTFPILLFAFDYYYARKFSIRLVVEKIPLIIISLIFGIVAIKSQDTAIQDLTPMLSLGERLLIVCWGVCLYLFKAIIPINMSAFYPYPIKTGGSLQWFYFVAPFILVFVAYFIWYSKKWGRDIIFGFAFFFITISLVLQLMPVGGAIMAERYTYVPYLGLFLVVVFPLKKLLEKDISNKILQKAKILLRLLIVFAIVLTISAYERTKYWKDGDVLFSDVISKYPLLPYAYNNRGFLYFDYYALKVYPENKLQKDKYVEKALQDYTMAINLDPNYVLAFVNRAVLLYNTDRQESALDDFNVVLKMDPKNKDGLIGRANNLSFLGRFEEAIPDYNNYLLIKTDDPKAFLWRGIAYAKTNEYELALSDFQMSSKLDPNDFEVFYWKGIVFQNMNNPEQALENFNQALIMNPDNPEILSWRGLTRYALKDYEMAIEDFSRAINLNPNELSSYVNRSLAYNELKMYDKALDDLAYAGERGMPINKVYYESLVYSIKQ